MEQSTSDLTIHITLPSPIIKNGIAFADSEEKEALNIFVITAANELYTFTLKRDLLTRSSASAEYDVSSTFKKFTSSSFSFRQPYRLVAASSLELFVSLHDGGLVRLDRQPNDGGSHWRETFFSEGGWSGTLKGLIPFSRPQTVRFGALELDSSSAVAIAKSPDGAYIWTLSLDYYIKAWSIKTGKIATQIDLLDDVAVSDERKKPARHVMSAEQGTLLHVVTPPVSVKNRQSSEGDNNSNYFLAVVSPKDYQIKFFAISTTYSSIEGDAPRCQDVQPLTKLIPPVEELMDTNIWHLESFFVKAGVQWMGSQMWIRARSGAHCKTFLLNFDLLDTHGLPTDISEQWRAGWSAVDSRSHSIERLKELPEYNDLDVSFESAATTPTERWLAFLFSPNRFSEASLETSLHVYGKGRGVAANAGRGLHTAELPLQERIATSVASKVTLHRHAESDQPDYDRYRADLQAQWETFFSVLAHLHSRRLEPIGFAVDLDEGLPWTIYADFVAPIRTCSDFELLCLNTEMSFEEDMSNSQTVEQIFANEQEMIQSRVIAAARQLRKNVSTASVQRLRNAAIARCLDSEPETTGAESLQAMCDQCGIAKEVTDEDYDALNATAEAFNGLGSLSDDDFLGILESLEAAPESIGPEQACMLPRYGVKSSIATVQEVLYSAQIALLDLLLLVVFMSGELEASELHADFRSDEIHDAIIRRMRDTELRLWLISNLRSKSSADSDPVTLHESMFLPDWDPRPASKGSPLCELLTTWSTRWTFGLVLSNWEGITEHIMANLLKYKDYELATEFLPFMTESSWTSEYLKARMHLMSGDHALASVEFRKAAEDLPEAKFASSPAVQRLLSAEELNYFGMNASKYYQHVSALFEKLKAFSYTADFASLALREFGSDTDVDQSIAEIDMRKSKSDRPTGEAIDDAMEEIRLLQLRTTKDDILNRLFNALVQTGRFDQAYQTLVTVVNPALRRANLQTLLQTCIQQDAISEFLELPIEADLAHEADGILVSLAKRHLGFKVSASSPLYHRILFAFRTRRADYRGAAAILYEHLESLRHGSRHTLQDPEDETLVQIYVLLINTLACCGPDEGWLLAEPVSGVHAAEAKRKLVTLEDVRRDYCAELDRRSDMLQGRFPVVGSGDDHMMDVL
jgi:nuclear pore complex protein Nup160